MGIFLKISLKKNLKKKMKTAIVLSLLIISTLSTDCAKYKISTNKKCGPNNGKTYCAAMNMCSQFGTCGRGNGYTYRGLSDYNYYKVPKVCREREAKPEINCSLYKYTTDHKCGNRNGRYCTTGRYCSLWGWCKNKDWYQSGDNAKFDGDKVPKECRSNALETEENVDLLGINPNHQGSKGYSGEFMLCAFIMGFFVTYLTFKIFSRKTSKDNGDFRFEVTPIVMAD